MDRLPPGVSDVIADAYPQQRVRWLPIYGSYLAGVGVNALIPARSRPIRCRSVSVI